MKKIICLALMFCCVSVLPMYAQTPTGRTSLSQVLKEVKILMDKFCRYVEVIGSTGSVSEKEKTRLRTTEVPTLFHHYEERHMITTSGKGANIQKSRKKMPHYFRNLQTQAKINKTPTGETVVYYKLSYILQGSGGIDGTGLDWKLYKEYPDGTKEYRATVKIIQEYIKETIINGQREMKVVRDENDVKSITIIEIVIPNGDDVYKLGDVTNSDRVDTLGK